MNILADEGVDGPIVDRLRRDGHRVWYVAEMAPAISDEMYWRSPIVSLPSF